ncbi:MAG TPA: FkbM family methyltransferase [Mucilaginibacter sp.]
MGFKLRVGSAIQKIIGKIILHNHRMAAFIPSGRILELDLKRVGFNPKCIFDVGANEGQTALNYLKYFPASTIYCFEPVKDVFDRLSAVIKTPQIKCVNKALGENTGQFTIYKNPDYNQVGSFNGAGDQELTEQETVEIIRGDEFCAQNNISEIDLLKIDVEGFEIQVLNGLEKLLSNQVKYIFVEAGFHTTDQGKTHISILLAYLYEHNFIVSGLYNYARRGGSNKLNLNHCDILLTNASLVNVN